MQLSAALGAIAVFMFHQPTRNYVIRHPQLFWVAMGVMIFTMLALCCFQDVRRTVPMNYIFLGVFTVAQSFMLGVVCIRYKTDIVLMAVGITAIVCLALTLFAFQSFCDFTVFGGALFVASIILLVLGLVAFFFPGRTISLVYASLGAFLFSVYLVYDTQMMMGGDHKYSISPDEYIFAALNLYLDIVQILLHILTILGILDN